MNQPGLSQREVYIPRAPGDVAEANKQDTGECDHTNQLRKADMREKGQTHPNHCSCLYLICSGGF